MRHTLTDRCQPVRWRGWHTLRAGQLHLQRVVLCAGPRTCLPHAPGHRPGRHARAAFAATERVSTGEHRVYEQGRSDAALALYGEIQFARDPGDLSSNSVEIARAKQQSPTY